MLDSNFIMKLVKTFADDKRIYFLNEYIAGEDMFDAIRNQDLLNNFMAQFYIGCLVLGMECMNEKGIVHRDLKPENVMIDK
jgi:serine/threonine protein kinase